MKVAAFALAATLLTAPAYAAEVAMFGITLGQPLGLPDCPLNANGGVNSNAVTQLCARAWPEDGPARTYDIGLPVSARPDYLAFPEVAVQVMDGNVAWINVLTTGATSQAKVLSQLVDKFGMPDRSGEQEMTNQAGAKISELRALWTFGDRAIVMEGFGLSGQLNRGVVYAYTKKWNDLQETLKSREPHL